MFRVLMSHVQYVLEDCFEGGLDAVFGAMGGAGGLMDTMQIPPELRMMGTSTMMHRMRGVYNDYVQKLKRQERTDNGDWILLVPEEERDEWKQTIHKDEISMSCALPQKPFSDNYMRLQSMGKQKQIKTMYTALNMGGLMETGVKSCVEKVVSEGEDQDEERQEKLDALLNVLQDSDLGDRYIAMMERQLAHRVQMDLDAMEDRGEQREGVEWLVGRFEGIEEEEGEEEDDEML
eukprot:TRINITY_DN3886_c0_g1_i1.p1 TRINITY_DN3886_c0_g1~~TRINITY_DN3886_c0_g1_i1.p1  ORF type:complete len:234 (-),score=78.42 TRINITY_DN3886_c0_g1_i1:309-1010(-)